MSNSSKKFLVYLLLFLIPFSLFFIQSERLTSFRMFVVEVSSVPLRIVLFPFHEAKKILFYRSTYNKYQHLKEEVDILRRQILEEKELQLENERLKNLLEFKENFVFSTVAANVLGRDPTSWSNSIIINRGRKHGLAQGMPVVSTLGVIGKVLEVGDSTSRVMLLTDPNFSVAALIQRNRESGLVTGSLQGICHVRYLSTRANIRVGDRVITSNLSSTFPENLLIGVVTSVEESQSSPTLECLLEPAVSLSQIEEVLVILKK